jgi:hypothetical protein
MVRAARIDRVLSDGAPKATTDGTWNLHRRPDGKEWKRSGIPNDPITRCSELNPTATGRGLSMI